MLNALSEIGFGAFLILSLEYDNCSHTKSSPCTANKEDRHRSKKMLCPFEDAELFPFYQISNTKKAVLFKKNQAV